MVFREDILNRKFWPEELYLYPEPNKKHMLKNCLFFCVYDEKQEKYLFLNDGRVYLKNTIESLLPRHSRLECLFFGDMTRVNELDKEDQYHWDTEITQNLKIFALCEDFYGPLPKGAHSVLKKLDMEQKITVSDYLQIEKMFILEQVKILRNSIGQKSLLEFER